MKVAFEIENLECRDCHHKPGTQRESLHLWSIVLHIF